jgi:hypothetical protein
MLTLARWYGWQPAGTTPPSDHELGGRDCIDWKGDPSDWGGLYFPAEGQWITEPDAKALAAALTRALLDVPEHDALGLKAAPVEPVDPRFDTAWGRKVAVGTPVNPFEEFSGPNKPSPCPLPLHCGRNHYVGTNDDLCGSARPGRRAARAGHGAGAARHPACEQ